MRAPGKQSGRVRHDRPKHGKGYGRKIPIGKIRCLEPFLTAFFEKSGKSRPRGMKTGVESSLLDQDEKNIIFFSKMLHYIGTYSPPGFRHKKKRKILDRWDYYMPSQKSQKKGYLWNLAVCWDTPLKPCTYLIPLAALKPFEMSSLGCSPSLHTQ